MIIDEKKCTLCKLCIPHCPVGAIKYDDEEDLVFIDLDECLECGTCERSGVCNYDAIYQPVLPLPWPRMLRAKWSSVVSVHIETGAGGRGTEEMKTNDVTGRFKPGEVGFAVEIGRPGVGGSFEDTEKVTMVLAKHGVEFTSENPVTGFIDTKTGRFLDSWRGYRIDESVMKEKVLSLIIEFKTKQEKMLDIIKALKQVSKRINTVMSVDLISKCTKGGKIPVKPILDKEGIGYYINGKTNVGLGKPAHKFTHN